MWAAAETAAEFSALKCSAMPDLLLTGHKPVSNY